MGNSRSVYFDLDWGSCYTGWSGVVVLFREHNLVDGSEHRFARLQRVPDVGCVDWGRHRNPVHRAGCIFVDAQQMGVADNVRSERREPAVAYSGVSGILMDGAVRSAPAGLGACDADERELHGEVQGEARWMERLVAGPVREVACGIG